MYCRDTIVACATAAGRGAVAIVRISGPDALAIGDRLFTPTRATGPEPRRLRHGSAVDPGSAEPLDDVLAVAMPAPASYTGEDVVELQCHGAPLVVERIVAVAVELGARRAEPGEFTRRAVLNGKMDLLQAEAVSDLIEARVAGGASVAWRQLQGALSERLDSIRGGIVGVLAEVEANVDFSDEELPEENTEARIDAIDAACAEIARLLAGFPAARRLKEGYRTVLLGRPNVGKSSLINRLLGSGRMIVCHEPGTTRDTVEEVVDLGGVAFVLTDTAGVRETVSAAETVAVERARAAAADADVQVLVFDGSTPWTDEDAHILAAADPRRAIAVVNKADLPGRFDDEARRRIERSAAHVLEVSALTGAGSDALCRALAALAAADVELAPALISRSRHREALERSATALVASRELLSREDAPELAAVELRTAVAELAAITSPLDNEEVLDLIFSEFCIGK